MKVNEIFYSVQGEGARAGHPSIFIRLTGCDMTCGFCDTEFTSGLELDPAQVYGRIRDIAQGGCKWIVWTGGEPMLQLTPEIIKRFHDWGYKQAIESNGNHAIPRELDWIVVSPKVADHVLARHFSTGALEAPAVDELRYVRHAGQLAVPAPGIRARHYYLSPMFRGDQLDAANVKHCLKLCLENPPWSLSLQLHKLLKVL
jgi:organic radical activating enzyme